jgi:hypothetical protein
MLGRWWRLALIPVLSGGILLIVATPPVLGADCALAAPPAPVPVGTQVSIVGSGFPADTAVAVTLTKAGEAPTEFTAQSDASGSFTLSLQVDTGDVGSTTVTAAVASVCTAEAVLVVTAQSTGTPPATTAPSPSGTPPATTAPSPSGTPPATITPSAAPGTAVASPSETPAAVATGPKGTASPSRSLAPTNAAPETPDKGQAPPSMMIPLGCLLLAIGVAGWIGQRSVGSRE